MKFKKHLFESQEYPYLNSDKSQFFNPIDSQVYEIRENTLEESTQYKCLNSLWNLSKGSRVSGLYLSAKNPIRFNFDYLGQVYLLELNSDSLIIQFLYFKGQSVRHQSDSSIANKGKKKEIQEKAKYKNPGKAINWGGLW